MERTASLFRNGRNQAVRIPRDMELPGNEVVIRKEGRTLIIEPKAKPSLLDMLDSMTPLPPEDWLPEIPELPIEPVDL